MRRVQPTHLDNLQQAYQKVLWAYLKAGHNEGDPSAWAQKHRPDLAEKVEAQRNQWQEKYPELFPSPAPSSPSLDDQKFHGAAWKLVEQQDTLDPDKPVWKRLEQWCARHRGKKTADILSRLAQKRGRLTDTTVQRLQAWLELDEKKLTARLQAQGITATDEISWDTLRGWARNRVEQTIYDVIEHMETRQAVKLLPLLEHRSGAVGLALLERDDLELHALRTISQHVSDYRVRRVLADRPGCLEDERIREGLLQTEGADVLADVLKTSTGQQFQRGFRRMLKLHPRVCLKLLEHPHVAGQAALQQEKLLELLIQPSAQKRRWALRLASKIQQITPEDPSEDQHHAPERRR